MTAFDPTLAAIRFGTGLSPRHAPPASIEAMIDDLAGPDRVAEAFPSPKFADVSPSYVEMRDAQRGFRGLTGAAAEDARAIYTAMQSDARMAGYVSFEALLARAVQGETTFRERLSLFWADHFTLRARSANTRHLVQSFVEEAIRPHLTGRFADMLYAVATHPMMMFYLDQQQSVGPNSPFGLRRGQGLNENYARELLELHTLGVGAGYSQADVTQLAELLTGLNWEPDTGDLYRPGKAEPGSETVLGQEFSAEADLSTIRAAIEVLAAHPQTAAHMARKIAVHFVSDDPDPDLVAALTQAWTFWQGDLGAVMSELVKHPASWAPERRKIRRPIEFIMASLRALDVPVAQFGVRNRRVNRDLYRQPLQAMAQAWEAPNGPDGWPEAGQDWITPQALATRIDWAMQAPSVLLPDLPDPRDFVRHALGPMAGERVVFAASAAQGRPEGIGLVLASPEFHRR